MGCLPSKNKAKSKKYPQAGYFAVTCTFKDSPIQAEEPLELTPKQIEVKEAKLEPKAKSPTKPASAKERLGKPLFGGGLTSGFGQFETMFSKKVEQKKVVKEKPKPVSRELDMAFIYQVPRKSKLNINPYANRNNTKEYVVRDGRVKGLLDTDDDTSQLLDYFRIPRPPRITKC